MPYSIDTPAGKFQIMVNGSPTGFTIISPSAHPIYGEPLDPLVEECRVIQISLDGLHKDDTVYACFERGKFSCDGGGENMTNIIATVDQHTVGLGGYDYFLPGEHSIPYDACGLVGSGLEYRIIKEPMEYSCQFAKVLSFIVAWQSSENEDAWNAVSLATS